VLASEDVLDARLEGPRAASGVTTTTTIRAVAAKACGPRQPDAGFELPDFNFDDSDNSQFDEWSEAIIACADVEAAREVPQWGEEQPFYGDPEQAAILAFFNVQRFRRLEEEELEYINDVHFEHAVEISC
jgi:hypothetical protein